MTITRETGTKIVATIGPASWDEDKLKELMLAGVDVCRINCSHSDHAGIRRQVARIRRTASQIGHPTAILLDLQGPKIRVGKVDGEIVLTKGDILTIEMDTERLGANMHVGTTYPELIHDVSIGDHILFADGLIGGHVTAIRPNDGRGCVDVTIEHGSVMTSNKGINLPGAALYTSPHREGSWRPGRRPGGRC